MEVQKFLSEYSKEIFVSSVILLLIVGVFSYHHVFSNLFSKNGKRIQPESKVAILDQFRNENPDFTKKATKLFEKENIGVDVYENITVNLYRQLPDLGYKVIILRVHSGARYRREGELKTFTSLFTTEKYESPKYPVLQTKGLIARASVRGEENKPKMFAITPKFVREEMRGEFDNTILILDSCSIINQSSDYKLVKAFNSRGIGSIISWNTHVTLSHGDKGTLRLLEYLLLHDMNLGNATEKVLDEVGPDPQYGAKLMTPAGSADLRLKTEDGELVVEK